MEKASSTGRAVSSAAAAAADHGEQRAGAGPFLPAADAGIEDVDPGPLGGIGEGTDRVEGDGGVDGDDRAGLERAEHPVGSGDHLDGLGVVEHHDADHRRPFGRLRR